MKTLTDLQVKDIVDKGKIKSSEITPALLYLTEKSYQRLRPLIIDNIIRSNAVIGNF
uniref:Uncharacterized protein n=1 Tax=viral metagenome TaxID=1070528 RepID=A0A6M3J4U0_9ZZZZ